MIHKNIFITGTGTDVGKTIVSTVMCKGLNARYWKPIQSGPELDAEFVGRWIGKEKVHPSRYELSRPLSPHQAAALDEVLISTSEIYKASRELTGITIIEGAGGLMVPLNANEFVIDLISGLKAAPLLVASSGLGTINHTLLSLEALRSRDLEPLGVILVGDDNPSNALAIQNYGRTSVLGRVPWTKEFSAEFFRDSFARLNWPRPEVPSYAH